MLTLQVDLARDAFQYESTNPVVPEDEDVEEGQEAGQDDVASLLVLAGRDEASLLAGRETEASLLGGQSTGEDDVASLLVQGLQPAEQVTGIPWDIITSDESHITNSPKKSRIRETQ